jgi:hypothetical protein
MKRISPQRALRTQREDTEKPRGTGVDDATNHPEQEATQRTIGARMASSVSSSEPQLHLLSVFLCVLTALCGELFLGFPV